MRANAAAWSRGESFRYLEAGRDFGRYDLVDPNLLRSRFAPALDAHQDARVDTLLRESVVISFHDHPQPLPADVTETPTYLSTRHVHTAYSALRGSDLTAVFDNWYGALGQWRWEDLISWLGLRQADIAHQDGVTVARTVDDLLAAKRDGDVAFVLGTESSTAIENDLDRIDALYGLGIRQMGLVYAESNAIGGGQKESRDGGLTVFGKRAVQRMNSLGVLIDVSHAGDQTSLEVIEASAKPVAITHAGARAVWPIPRLKPDDVLKACAERGGVLGIESAPHTTISLAHRTHSIESVMDHFTYAVDLMGIDHVAFGPDTFFGDHVGFHRAMGESVGFASVMDPGDVEYERVRYVDGMENPSENLRNVTRWLVAHDYSDDEISAVLGGNILRLLREVWQ